MSSLLCGVIGVRGHCNNLLWFLFSFYHSLLFSNFNIQEISHCTLPPSQTRKWWHDEGFLPTTIELIWIWKINKFFYFYVFLPFSNILQFRVTDGFNTIISDLERNFSEVNILVLIVKLIYRKAWESYGSFSLVRIKVYPWCYLYV